MPPSGPVQRKNLRRSLTITLAFMAVKSLLASEKSKTAAEQLLPGSPRIVVASNSGIFRSADAEYLDKARRIVPPVTDLKIKVPPGRRDHWPADPARVEELGRRYGVASSFERLLKALALI